MSTIVRAIVPVAVNGSTLWNAACWTVAYGIGPVCAAACVSDSSTEAHFLPTPAKRWSVWNTPLIRYSMAIPWYNLFIFLKNKESSN